MTIRRIARLSACAALLALAAPAETRACPSQCSNTVQIVDCDDRTQGPTTPSAALAVNGPWRHVGRFDLPGGCTGTLIGPKHVLTAAHCVLNLDNTFSQGPIRFRLAQFDDSICGHPYGSHYAVRVFVPAAYNNGSITAANKALDYAVVELANPIPGAVPMSFSYQTWATVHPLTPYSIGYPGDKSEGSLWQTGSTNDFLTTPLTWQDNGAKGLFHLTNDGARGQSGAPVYVFISGQRQLVGVLIGSPVAECQAGRLWAARLTPGTVERIQNAMLFPPNGNVFDFSLRWRTLSGADLPVDQPPASACGF